MGVAGSGRVARILRLLLLIVLVLAAVEYLFGSILDASPLRSNLYAPIYNAKPKIKSKKLQPRPKKLLKHDAIDNLMINSTETSSNSLNNIAFKATSYYMNRHNVSQDTSTSLLISKIMEGIQNLMTTEAGFREETSMPMCDDSPSDLGPLPVNKTELELDYVEQLYPDVRSGGLYSSPNCTARHRVAIIVPYRNRQQHLPIFLNHMHPFLMKQQIEYGIYIIEQEGERKFNRAKLLNVGFVESLKQRSWQCFIFHDIDFLPLDSRNHYSCVHQPRLMSVSIEKFEFRLPYEAFFGGVVAMTLEQFSRVNGFSNRYWGWGGEDDDMSNRLKKMNYRIARYKQSVARYAMLNHSESVANPSRFRLLAQTNRTFQIDGLSTLKYELVKVTPHHLYTHILANLDGCNSRKYFAKMLLKTQLRQRTLFTHS